MRALIEIAKILPPLTHFFGSNRVIHFKEVGTTGFGDRLRGISLLRAPRKISLATTIGQC